MNFAFMKKQLAFAEGFVIPRAAGHVLSDVGVDEERTARLEVDIIVADVGFAFAEGLDLVAVKDESRFHLFEDVVVVRGGAVLRDNFFARLLRILGLAGALPGLLGRLGHNLSFYLMKRLIRMSGTAAPPGGLLPSDWPPVRGKAGELPHGTV